MLSAIGKPVNLKRSMMTISEDYHFAGSYGKNAHVWSDELDNDRSV